MSEQAESTAFVKGVFDTPANKEPEGKKQEVDELENNNEQQDEGDEQQHGGDGDQSDDAARAAAEKKARVMGWKPQAEYKGKNEWVDAETFLARGEESLPLMQRRMENMQRQLDETVRTAQEYKKFVEGAAEARWRTHYEDLKAKEALAVTEGDGEAFVKTREELAAHVAAKPVVTAPVVNQPSVEDQTVINEWQTQNPWIKTHPDVAAFAIARGQQLKLEGKNLDGILFGMREAVERTFPDVVGVRQSRSGPQRGGRTSGNMQGGGKTYDDLPPEAKKACDDFIRKGFIKNKQQYLSNYQW